MQKTIKVYLSGPMYKTLEEATVWRNQVSAYLNSWSAPSNSEANQGVAFKILDPCVRWYDNKALLYRDSAWVVKMDKDEIAVSDVVIVNATDPGWGTPMEQYIAYISGKTVIAFANREYPSIWVKEHSHVLLSDHYGAARWLCRHAKEIARRMP
jgi:nucleoside 2-deoxyribosyltransferase